MDEEKKMKIIKSNF